MPTFRKSELGGCAENEIELPYQLPAVRNRKELEEIDLFLRMKKMLLIIKKHPLQTGWSQDTQEFTNIRYVSEAMLEKEKLQLYELIGISDALISDYSSVAVDYLLLDRPLGYVLADYEIYREKRGFVFDARDLKQFLLHISDGTDAYRAERRKMLSQMHNQTENYCKRLATYFKL